MRNTTIDSGLFGGKIGISEDHSHYSKQRCGFPVFPCFVPGVGIKEGMIQLIFSQFDGPIHLNNTHPCFERLVGHVTGEKGDPMDESAINIRLMRAEDYDAVVGIDKKVLKNSRVEYYETRFEKLFKSKDYLPTSLVAEDKDGKVVGFVMGVLYMGEYGIHREEATLDTIGVDPDYQRMGIGKKMINEFLDHLKSLGVTKINTLVDWNDSKLIHFFSANQFSPSKSINLERTL